MAYDGFDEDYYGTSVSVYNNIAVVGAHFDDDKGANSGKDNHQLFKT